MVDPSKQGLQVSAVTPISENPHSCHLGTRKYQVSLGLGKFRIRGVTLKGWPHLYRQKYMVIFGRSFERGVGLVSLLVSLDDIAIVCLFVVESWLFFNKVHNHFTTWFTHRWQRHPYPQMTKARNHPLPWNFPLKTWGSQQAPHHAPL